MDEERKRGPRKWVRVMIWLNLIWFLTGLLVPPLFSEQSVFTFLIENLPPVAFVAPSLLLGVICSVGRRWRLALAHLAVTVLGAWQIMGFTYAAPRQGSDLRVMTLNVRRGHNGVERLVEAIREANPHVAVLVDSDTLDLSGTLVDSLESELPGYRWIRNGQITVATKLRSVSTNTVQLPHALPSRPLVELNLELNGKPVRLLAVHLSRPEVFLIRNGLDRFTAEVKRAARTRKLQVGALLEHGGKGDIPTVVCGDFNLPPRSDSYGRLAGKWNDAFAEAGRGYGYTFRPPFSLLRVDYVWVSSGWLVNRAFTDAEGASDHLAVVADLKLKS